MRWKFSAAVLIPEARLVPGHFGAGMADGPGFLPRPDFLLLEPK